MSIADNFSFQGVINEPNIGQSELWKHRQADIFAVGLSYPSNYPQQQLQLRSDWDHPGIFRLLSAELQQQDNLPDRIHVYYEYFTTTLQQNILQRVRSGQLFKEDEVWVITDQLLQCLKFLQSKGTICGDLRSGTIYVKNNEYKILDKSLNQCNGGNDMFGLGMTILELCTLQNPLVILNVTTKQVNETFLEMLLEEMSSYSKFLQRVVKQMLNLEKQLTLDEIEMVLQPYIGRIRQQKPFEAKRQQILQKEEHWSIPAPIPAPILAPIPAPIGIPTNKYRQQQLPPQQPIQINQQQQQIYSPQRRRMSSKVQQAIQNSRDILSRLESK